MEKAADATQRTVAYQWEVNNIKQNNFDFDSAYKRVAIEVVPDKNGSFKKKGCLLIIYEAYQIKEYHKYYLQYEKRDLEKLQKHVNF